MSFSSSSSLSSSTFSSSSIVQEKTEKREQGQMSVNVPNERIKDEKKTSSVIDMKGYELRRIIADRSLAIIDQDNVGDKIVEIVSTDPQNQVICRGKVPYDEHAHGYWYTDPNIKRQLLPLSMQEIDELMTRFCLRYEPYTFQ